MHAHRHVVHMVTSASLGLTFVSDARAGENSIVIVGGANVADWDIGDDQQQVRWLGTVCRQGWGQAGRACLSPTSPSSCYYVVTCIDLPGRSHVLLSEIFGDYKSIINLQC